MGDRHRRGRRGSGVVFFLPPGAGSRIPANPETGAESALEGIAVSHFNRILIAAFAAGALTACASKAPPPPPPPPPAPVAEEAPVEKAPEVVAPVYTPTPGLSAKERFRTAVKLLETGEAGQAKAELQQYIAETPNSKVAQGLLAQIDTPIKDYFPEESFTVTIAPGESLSTLAQTFLRDPLKFFVLARYNGIENPSQISVGQTIRIPQTPETLAAKEARARGETQKPAAAEAAAAAEQEEETEAPTAAEQPAQPAPKGSMEKVRALAAAGDADGAIKEVETYKLGATANAADATFIADTYLASARSLKGSNPSVAAQRARRAGNLYLKAGDKADKALEAAQLASSLAPNDKANQTLLASAKEAATDRYYRAGLSAFRRQELDTAIRYWDKVLEIDPNHENAKLQRAQAVELKEKLSKLK
ncbi:MAG: LysM peptidoglycan-binding domain-containing protein [Alphaproteobacteria bacterium]|nr:LysM peptidoglycan-binding domain-containing protein [Alphaproteobacteria bacterium]